jgi:hydroxypyruvate isomerase
MPKFAANLTMLFNEVPFLDRFELAAQSGFKAVEFLFPYPFPAADIKQRLDQHQLTLVLHNLPAGDWEAGERGIAIPIARKNFVQVLLRQLSTLRRWVFIS